MQVTILFPFHLGNLFIILNCLCNCLNYLPILVKRNSILSEEVVESAHVEKGGGGRRGEGGGEN
jgi:hypothetical protein